MLRQVLFVLGWIVAAATGFWIQQLQRENANLRDKIKAANVARTQAEAEIRRVYEMYEHEHSLVQAAAPLPTNPPRPAAKAPAPAPKADPEPIQAAQRRVNELTEKLRILDSDNHVVDQRSQAYRQQQDARVEKTKTDLVTRLHAIGDTLKALQERITDINSLPKAPDRKAAMQALDEQRRGLVQERQQIQNQLNASITQERKTDSAIHQEVMTEKNEIATERDALQRELNAARAELARLRGGK